MQTSPVRIRTAIGNIADAIGIAEDARDMGIRNWRRVAVDRVDWRRRLVAVSYTHLDVYKRQTLYVSETLRRLLAIFSLAGYAYGWR